MNGTGGFFYYYFFFFSEIWPHTPALKPGSVQLPNFDKPVESQVPKIKDTTSERRMFKATSACHLDVLTEKALQSTCKCSADGRSGQSHHGKPPLGNDDPKNDTLGYVGLFCDLHSTDNLYTYRLQCLLTYWAHPRGYSSLSIPFKGISS